MTFLEHIFAQLEATGDTAVLWELHDGAGFRLTGRGLLDQVAQARAFLRQGPEEGRSVRAAGAQRVDWVAMDLAIMAEGLIVVPLYARQAPAELVAMMKDCSPSLICCGDAALRDAITSRDGRMRRHNICSRKFLLSRKAAHQGSHNWPSQTRSPSSIRRALRARPRAWC